MANSSLPGASCQSASCFNMWLRYETLAWLKAAIHSLQVLGTGNSEGRNCCRIAFHDQLFWMRKESTISITQVR